MRFIAILNRDGGTLKTLDVDDLAARIVAAFAVAGHQVEIRVVTGSEIVEALDAAVEGEAGGVLIGGGDGSVSAAAARLMDTGKVLAVLPAGTMNLFARSLGIPLRLDEAIEALAAASPSAVDVALANGRPFIHQYSVGMHAKLVDQREKRQFASRLGKIRASAVAAFSTLRDPPRLKIRLDLPDGTRIEARTSSLGITNNLYGEGHIPFADRPDGGVLGIYLTRSRSRAELARFVFSLARGSWADNAQVEIHPTHEVTLEVLASGRRARCVIDGELCHLDQVTHFQIRRLSLNVLRVRTSQDA